MGCHGIFAHFFLKLHLCSLIIATRNDGKGFTWGADLAAHIHCVAVNGIQPLPHHILW